MVLFARNILVLSLCQSDEDGNFLFVAPRSPLSSPTIWEVFTPKLCFKRLQLKTTFAQTCSNQIHLYFHQCIWIGNRAKFKVKSCCGFRLCENFSDRSVIEIWLLGGAEEVGQSQCDFLRQTFHGQLPNALKREQLSARMFKRRRKLLQKAFKKVFKAPVSPGIPCDLVDRLDPKG